jgi:probable rRNA maturation factor
MRNVFVFDENKVVINKRKVHSIIGMISEELNTKVNYLEVNFVNPETIITINKKFLRHNYSTDIITFDYSNNKNILDGEIFISFQDAVENSEKYKVNIDNELCRLVIHGILHLVGYDDTTTSKKRIMKAMENNLVNKFKRVLKGLTVKQ